MEFEIETFNNTKDSMTREPIMLMTAHRQPKTPPVLRAFNPDHSDGARFRELGSCTDQLWGRHSIRYVEGFKVIEGSLDFLIVTRSNGRSISTRTSTDQASSRRGLVAHTLPTPRRRGVYIMRSRTRKTTIMHSANHLVPSPPGIWLAGYYFR